MASTNPFDSPSNDTPMTPIQTKTSRPSSHLVLPLAGMDSLSRTTTIAGTPGIGCDTPSSTHPFSAFYSHPQCAVSNENRNSLKESTTSFDKDIEKGLQCPTQAYLTPQASARPSCEPSLFTTHTNTSFTTPVKTMTTCGKTKSTVCVWPAGSEVRQRKKDAKRMKGCRLFRNLSRKQKVIAKICIAILIVGIATAIGCAISYKTGGLVWKSSNNYGAIGS